MLYNKEFYGTKKEEFIFSAEPYNEDIDVRRIASIQEFYNQNGYIPEQNIPELLNWITYRARKNVTSSVESPLYDSLAGKCAPAQSFNDKMLEQLGLQRMAFNAGKVVGQVPIHALECVQIPTLINGEITNKLYILDPTFRQFCLKEENRFERYYEEPRWSVKMSTPHPGYFLNLTDEGRNFANNLIYYGYFEVTEENLKTYFDAFSLYITPKESYPTQNLIGVCSSTTATGTEYWNKMVQNIEKPLSTTANMDLSTPREIVRKEEKKLLNRFKNMIINNQEVEQSYKIR